MTANYSDDSLKAKWLQNNKATKCPTVVNIGVTGLSNELDHIIGIDTRCLYDQPPSDRTIQARNRRYKAKKRLKREV
jgi:hypothetical protein